MSQSWFTRRTPDDLTAELRRMKRHQEALFTVALAQATTSIQEYQRNLVTVKKEDPDYHNWDPPLALLFSVAVAAQDAGVPADRTLSGMLEMLAREFNREKLRVTPAPSLYATAAADAVYELAEAVNDRLMTLKGKHTKIRAQSAAADVKHHFGVPLRWRKAFRTRGTPLPAPAPTTAVDADT